MKGGSQSTHRTKKIQDRPQPTRPQLQGKATVDRLSLYEIYYVSGLIWGLRDGSVVKSTCFLAEDMSLTPSKMVAHYGL